MRAFISINTPESIKQEILKIQKQLPEFKGKLTEKENLHLTLKFLGEISPLLLDNVKNALSKIRFSPLSLSISEIGTFSFQGNPRIVWLKLEGTEELQRKIDNSLSDLLPKEARFMSHLTIARVKYVDNVKLFNQEISKIKISPLSWQGNSFKLMSSTLHREGPVYETLEEYKTQQ